MAQAAGNSGGALLVRVTVPHTSLALAWASHATICGSLRFTPPWVLHSSRMGGGTLSDGGSRSTTVTLELPVLTSPQSSVAVQVTMVTWPGRQPEGKNAGASFLKLLRPQLSAPCAWASQAWIWGLLAGTPLGELHSMTIGFGTWTVGLVLSNPGL